MSRTGLPGLDADIVLDPEWRLVLTDIRRRIHVSKVGGGAVGLAYEGKWEYAVLLRNVRSVKVIAHGQDVETGTPKTHDEVARMIEEEVRGENGTALDALPQGSFAVAGEDGQAHVRRFDDTLLAYCGHALAAPRRGDLDAYRGHCVECDAAYRAAHYGRVPVLTW